ncbi:MAG: RodZ domain-containing protein [Thermodesulfobacteriota bacterium]
MTEEEQKQDAMPETANQDEVSPRHNGIGAFLREEREKKGLSHRAVAERTRLRAHFLEALEKEEWDALPPPAFVRGFLRTYARLLSLDERMVLDLYNRAVPARESALGPLIQEPPVGRKRRVILLLCMLIAVAALVLVWKEYVSRYADQGAAVREPPAVESRKAEVSVLPDEGGRLGVKGTEAAKPPLPETPRAEPVASPEHSAGPQSDSQIQTPLPAPPGELQGDAQPASDTVHRGEHVLQASVSARTWLRIQIDDTEPREYMFQPGNRPEWKARQGFYLIIGNAGGIDLTFDGEGIAKLGGPGQVVRLRLPGDSPRAAAEE